jgi:TM2 domain-containing membrane protein YozV
MRREIGTSYLLCAIGFLGVAGLHRFYLGKPVTGILWLLTGGLLGIGTIYDLITLPGQVDQTNRKALTGSSW